MRLQPFRDFKSASSMDRISLSQDLGLIVINNVCYIVRDDIDVAQPIPLSLSHACSRSNLRMDFSPCNSYISETDTGAIEPNRQPRLRIYRIESEGVSGEVVVPGDLGLSNYAWLETAFHPKLPILAVIGMTLSQADRKDSYTAKFTCYVVVFKEIISYWTKLGDRSIRDYKGCVVPNDIVSNGMPEGSSADCVAHFKHTRHLEVFFFQCGEFVCYAASH